MLAVRYESHRGVLIIRSKQADLLNVDQAGRHVQQFLQLKLHNSGRTQPPLARPLQLLAICNGNLKRKTSRADSSAARLSPEIVRPVVARHGWIAMPRLVQ